MPMKTAGRRYDRINDLIEKSKMFATRSYSSSLNIPTLFYPKSFGLDDYFSLTKFDEDFLEQKNQVDVLLKGKSLPWSNDEQTASEISEYSFPKKKTSFVPSKTNDENFFHDENYVRSLQRELQEKDLDIQHLQREIQELKNEKKLPNFESEENENQAEILRNELRLARELIIKLQSKPGEYEKQLHHLANDNELLKQQCQQSERTITRLKQDKEQLEEKVAELIKRNDELFIQELQLLRNDVKLLKERNENLIEENQQLQRRFLLKNHETENRLSFNEWRSQQAEERTEFNIGSHPTKCFSHLENDSPFRPYVQSRSNQYRTTISNETNDRVNLEADGEKSTGSNYQKSRFNASQRRWNIDVKSTLETMNLKRPFVPLSIKDIHLNDVVKFSRPEGKISKGTVKFIGTLPDRIDHYLGLELEDEDSKHDGTFQGQRYFQCKPNKGVFVSFNKVILAWT